MKFLALLAVLALSACPGPGPGPVPSPSPTATPTPKPTPKPTPVPTATPCGAPLRTLRLHSHTVHILLPRIGRAALPACADNLQDGGGPVQTAPKIYLVLWGSTWTTTGDPDNEAALLQTFFGAVGGSTWNATTVQYGVGNAPSLAGVWNDASGIPLTPTDSDLGNEAIAAATHFNVFDTNANFVIATPSGIVPTGFPTSYCAWHAVQSDGRFQLPFTNLPYLPDVGAPCGAGSVTQPGTLDGVTIVAGHEEAETETDPLLNAWVDNAGEEIGDKCAWIDLQSTAFGQLSFPTQPLWSNAVSGCVQ